MPDYRLAVHGKFNRQVFCGKPPIGRGRISQRERAGFDRQCLIRFALGYRLFKLRYRQPAIEKHERSVIFKLAVRRPLHADHFRRQHGEPRLTQRNHGLWIGDRAGSRIGRVGRRH